MAATMHFYLTFNPYLNHEHEQNYTQAHEFYDFLKEKIKGNKNSTAHWGKMIGNDRESSLDISKFQEIKENNDENNLSTHLYISDFHHLWVGKVKAITSKIDKNANTLSFYKGKKVEVWFEIEDFILIEHNHEETANKLSELYIDNKYSELKINGLSPFTTSITYPCILQDIAEEQFFDEFDDENCSHLILKNNPAISKNNSDQVLRALHTYAFPEEVYSKLPHAAKLEIESAEMDLLEQRHHNMHKVAFSYLRALEIIMNDLIIHHIKRKGLGDQFFVDTASFPPKLFLHPTKDSYIPLTEFNKNFSIAHLMSFVDRVSGQAHMGFRKAFSEHKDFIRFISKDFSEIVRSNDLIGIRNALAHGEGDKLSFKDAMAVRAIILGCGMAGLIPSCYRHFYKDRFKHLYNVTGISDKKPSNKGPKASKSKLKLVA